jgi:Papain family cysteine protease
MGTLVLCNCKRVLQLMAAWHAGVRWAVDRGFQNANGTSTSLQLSSYGRIDGCGEEAMMSEIYQRGPIVCSIASDDKIAYGYRGGVYMGANSSEVDHNVEVVGWGVEDGVPYWHVRNSWGAPPCL